MKLLRIAAIVVLTQPAFAQSRQTPAVIDGIVTDTSLVALADATVSILGSRVRVATGASGRFRILGLSPGEYILVVNRIGYAPVSASARVTDRDTLRLSFAMSRAVAVLDTVVVATKPYTTRMAEFEERRKVGFGQFMTQEQIEKRNTVYAKELLRTFMSVEIRGEWAVNRRMGIPTPITKTCPFQFFIDGVAIPTPKLDAELPSPKEIAGIEVHASSATVPLQYKTASGGGFCGVILLWTRGG
jgi:hypothetical protein